MRSKTRIVALALVLAALAVVPAGTDLRADSPGSATITTLTATAGETAQTDTMGAIARGTVETDRAALMTLYHGNNGPGWIYKFNWGTTRPLNTWSRVTTNSDGRVTALALGGNNLTDSLPAALGDLDQLQQLYLWGNRLSGRIPDLSSLTNLTELYLNNNQFSQSIPASLGDLTNLTILSLYSNLLSGAIPPELGNLTSLTTLYLTTNQLWGVIPDELGGLTNLTQLWLNNNQFTGAIPEELGNLTNLAALHLENNQLIGAIPDELGYLTNLTELHLHSNLLSGSIPDSLGNLTSLTTLSLYSNGLTGPIPAEFGNLTNLTQLYLNTNQLDGSIPDELGNLTSLTHLELFLNQLTGSIPESLGDLTTLRFTRFAYNLLTGCVPLGLRYLITADEVDSLPAQDFIEYDGNNDGDAYDPGDVPGLELPFCMVSGLTFSGVTIAPAFANSTATYTASVATTVTSTTVTATLPHSGDRASISKRGTSYTNGASVPLAVGPNEITITVTARDGAPAQTYSVTVFREGEDQATLMLLYDSVGGGAWTDNSNWGSTTAPVNQWFGVEADSNGTVTKLELPGNNLSGALPDDLGSLIGLTVLDLSGNRLTGTIPELTALTSLQTLDLGDNLLSGEIPEWLGDQTPTAEPKLPLRELSLRGNQFSGVIPRSLGDVYLLEVLYLDRNQLSGPITAAFGNLLRLKAARFADNALTGCVPNELRKRLVGAPPFENVPAHDFIPVDTDGDGDFDDVGDTPGLNLPFCMLRDLTFSDARLEPAFASDTIDATDLTASADHGVLSTRVMAALHNSRDTVSIMRGTDTYMNNELVPLDVGANIITLEITPAYTTPARTYTITLTRAPNTPPAFDEGPTATRGVDENTTADEYIGNPVRATDADDDTLTYSLDATGAESFDIDTGTGQLRTKAELDFEDKSRYTVTVSVRDSKNDNGDDNEATDDTITVTILVADMNEAPEFPSSETGMRSVDENTSPGENIGAPVAATDDDNDTLTYALDFTSRDNFGIVPTTGQLQTKANLDFEDGPRDYTVTVTATDPAGLDDTITVTITVDNVDEPGTVTLSSVQPIVGQTLTATVSDPDTITSDIDWLWERSSNQTSWTAVSTTTNDPITSSYLLSADDVGRYMRATASYTDELGAGKSARVVSINQVQEAPLVPNEDPEFPSTETGARNVDENTLAGEDIGAPVRATDPENDRLTYTLDATGAESFEIVWWSGQLRTKADLDHEATRSYSVTVTATDPSTASDSIFVDITVTDVNEPPAAVGDSDSTDEDMAVTIDVLSNDDDPDAGDPNDTLTVSLRTRPTNGVAEVDAATNDITYTPRANYHGADSFTYTVSDDDGLTSEQATVNVTVDSVNDPPAFPPAAAERSVAPGAQAGTNVGRPVTATDVDRDTLTYELSGADAAPFGFNAQTAQITVRSGTVLDPEVQPTYAVTVTATEVRTDALPPLTASVDVTITVTTPRRSGGGGGSFGGPILTVTTVVAGEAPANLSFEFAYTCANTRGELLSTRTFPVAAGRTFGLLIAAGLSCSLAVTDDGGATAVEGLFTDVVIPPAGYKTTVTFTFGPAPTAVALDAETVVEESGVSLTIPEGSRDAPYSVLLETDDESCEAALDLEGESLACYTVTVFDADGEEEEESVELLVPATITITLDPTRVEQLGGIEGVRAARERGELRMLQRADAESPWRELPFTVGENADGAVEIVVSVQHFSDFSLVTTTPRTQTIALHADWTVVVWDGADGASIPEALGGLGASAGGSDVSAQVGVVYHWVAETQSWASFRPGAPTFLNGFDTFERGASYWVRSSDAVEWTVVSGPVEPPTTEAIRLHHRWTEVVWRGADGAPITEALGPDVPPQVEVIYRWLVETQSWGSFRPGAPAFLNAFDTFASGGSYWIAVAEGVDWMAGRGGG